MSVKLEDYQPDLTGASFSDTAFAAALAATPAGGTLKLPRGKLKLANSYTRTTAITIEGEGVYGGGGCEISYTGAGHFLTLGDAAAGGNLGGTVLRGFSIRGTSSGLSGVYYKEAHNQIANYDLFIEGFSTGAALRLKSAWGIRSFNCTFRLSAYGVLAEAGGTFPVVNTIGLVECDIINNAIGISCYSGEAWQVFGCDFSGFTNIAVELGKNLVDSGIAQLRGMSFTDNYYEGSGTPTKVFSIGNGSTSTFISDIKINGGFADCSCDYIVIDRGKNFYIRDFMCGGFGSGKKRVIIASGVQNTVIDLAETTNITDNGTNTQIRGGSSTPASGVTVQAVKTAGQSAPIASYTTITYDSEDLDTNGEFSLITNRYTPTTAGWRNVHAAMALGPVNTGVNVNISIHKNGTRIAQQDVYSTASASYPSVHVKKAIYFNGTTDYIEVKAIHSDSVSRTITGQSDTTYVTIG